MLSAFVHIAPLLTTQTQSPTALLTINPQIRHSALPKVLPERTTLFVHTALTLSLSHEVSQRWMPTRLACLGNNA
ncbi:hypothetical protein HZS61_010136 [Fusarium oxysporum f. sp. conglutinans]|uniref:Uncharacterized protein n=1 Tax=Fusarium oxysporum f. sp. conglutinans TaxID=100902 RepID=A0A8H6H0R2_FUSOX|nr:hypothetical protein HZS61_010136 [Fusarium oxysporum f. sp. conglutinans]